MKNQIKLLYRLLGIATVVFILSFTNHSCKQSNTDEQEKVQVLADEAHSDKLYKCPPCGCDSQGILFSEPGLCPSCGMELREVTDPAEKNLTISKAKPLKSLKKKINVAVFVFDHSQVLDYAGPYDVFGSNSNFNVYTVGDKPGLIETGNRLTISPSYDVTNAPEPDIIIVPAGHNTSLDERAREWIINSAEQADHVMSVCNGATLLAELGLLDNLEATAHKAGIGYLEKKFPKIKKVHRNKRYVDNGKIITSGGVSAGIDASFYLISKILGEDSAQATANAIEYLHWDPSED